MCVYHMVNFIEEQQITIKYASIEDCLNDALEGGQTLDSVIIIER